MKPVGCIDRVVGPGDHGSMRFLLSRTDALGDLVISLSVQARILQRDPGAEVHWLVRPYAAPLLEQLPGVAGVHCRAADADLAELFRSLRPDAVLNLGHRDQEVVAAAKRSSVPVRVARARGLRQILGATNLIWRRRFGTGRHEAMNLLDFLRPWKWDGGAPEAPKLFLTEGERAQGMRDLGHLDRPLLGIFVQGTGAGAHPSAAWWKQAQSLFFHQGWTSVFLGPPDFSDVPPTDLRGLMGRMAACDAIISPSSGPAHIAPALGVPLICLMGLRPNHSPDRWTPMGSGVQVIQYPPPEADLSDGMDRLNPEALLPHLARLHPASTQVAR